MPDPELAVSIEAVDPEGGPLAFWWTLSSDGPVISAESVLEQGGSSSEVTIAYDESLSGQTLRSYVEDGENVVVVDWALETAE